MNSMYFVGGFFIQTELSLFPSEAAVTSDRADILITRSSSRHRRGPATPLTSVEDVTLHSLDDNSHLITLQDTELMLIKHSAAPTEVIVLPSPIATTALGEIVWKCVLPFLYYLNGSWVVLHATSLAHGNGSFAIMGLPGAGKSTLAAYLSHNGAHCLLSDDVMPINAGNGAFWTYAMTGPLRLRQGSYNYFLQRGLITTGHRESDKYSIRNRAAMSSGAYPVRLLFYLDPFPSPGTLTVCRTLDRIERTSLLMRNLYSPGLSVDAGNRKRTMSLLFSLADSVQVHALRYPKQFSQLGDIASVIAQALGDTGSPP